MNDNSITLTTSEQRRLTLTVLTQVEAGRLSKEEAAELLGITERQIRRLRTAFRRRGVGALVTATAGDVRSTQSIPIRSAGWSNWPPPLTPASTSST